MTNMDMNYQPELGQAVFGAEYEDVEASWAASGLSFLTEVLADKYPDDADPGYGFYGDGFRNDVFALRCYWWNGCTCGFDEQDRVWSEKHEHADTCFSVRLGKFEENLKQRIEWLKPEYEQRVAVWAITNGYPHGWEGCAVYCDCGRDAEYTQWREAGNDHLEDCREVLPNFEHFSSGLKIHWYKYVGRGMSANLIPDDWQKIVAECLESLRS